MKLSNDFGLVPIHRWQDRVATASEIILQFERDEEWEKIEMALDSRFRKGFLKKTLVKIGGGCCISLPTSATYEVCNPPFAQFFITFHLDTVYIGKSVRPYYRSALPEPEKPIQ